MAVDAVRVRRGRFFPGRVIGAVAALLAAMPAAAAQGIYTAGDGLRFGIFGQAAISDYKVDDKSTATSFKGQPTNGRFGLSFGYDWRIDRTVLGIEADGAIGNEGFRYSTYTFASDYFASFRGRLGFYVHPDVLLYSTAGLGLTGIEYKTTTPASSTSSATKISATLAGVTVGGGIEYDFYGLRTFAEYLYTTNEKWTFKGLGANLNDSISADVSTHQIRAGIKFNLNPEYVVTPQPVYK